MSSAMLSAAQEADIDDLQIRSAHNLDRVGLLDIYVCWISGRDSTSPPQLRIDTNSFKAYAKPGRCCYSRSGLPLEANYDARTQGK